MKKAVAEMGGVPTRGVGPQPGQARLRGLPSVRQAECQIPELAAQARHKAYRASLELTGAAVVKTSRGQIVERRLAGSVVVLKTVSQGLRMKPGSALRRVK